jgi:hypothetical protein
VVSEWYQTVSVIGALPVFSWVFPILAVLRQLMRNFD